MRIPYTCPNDYKAAKRHHNDTVLYFEKKKQP